MFLKTYDDQNTQDMCLPWTPKVRKSVEVGSLFRKKMVITWDYGVEKFFQRFTYDFHFGKDMVSRGKLNCN